MTNGSEPRRRRWSSDSSRRAAEARRAAEEDDAENLLSAFRPVPSERDVDSSGSVPGAPPVFGSPQDDRPPFEEAPRRGRSEPIVPAGEPAPRRSWRRSADAERPVEPVPERDDPASAAPPRAEPPLDPLRRSRRGDPATAGPPSWPPVTPVNPAGRGRPERPTGSVPVERPTGSVPVERPTGSVPVERPAPEEQRGRRFGLPGRGGSRDEPGAGRFRAAPEPPSRGFAGPEQAPQPPSGRARPTEYSRRPDDGPVSGSHESPPYGRRAAPEPPVDRRTAPEAPSGHRAAPEPPTGRRAAAEPPTGRRAAPEPNDWGSGPALYGAPPSSHGPASDQPTWAVDSGRHTRARGPAGDAGPAGVDPVRPARGGGRHERPADPAVERGRHSNPPEVAPPAQEQLGRGRPDGYGGDRSAAYQTGDRAVRGRRRAPEPDEQPSGGHRPADFSARASVSVPGTPAPPAPPPVRPVTPPPVPAAPGSPGPQPATRAWQPRSVSVDPTETALGRPSANARVVPAGSARVPTAARMPAAAPPGMDPRDAQRPASELDDLWSPPELPGRDSRRATEDSGRIRRRPEDSGSIRRRSREDRRVEEKRPSPLPTTWVTTALIVVGVIVLGLIATGGYFLINSGSSSTAAKQPTSGAGAGKTRDISSRDVDQAALTEQELFPGKQISVDAANYQVLKTQSSDCQSAATDDIAKLLGELDCTQVVRGTLKSPDGQFLVTAGIFNLKDEASANKAYESIKPALDAQKGRFTGLPAGDGTEAIVRAPTTLGWHPLGHFLAYAIVARADGKPIAADDAASKEVISDIVEGHLRDSVIAARAATPAVPK
ncbi:hypothetical protein [Planosporangium mesophilum]|uniref:Uncharacterized protein n=1 Tax=Planosporangium mesophilum TaxID=689768 RepID=A0A8J3TE91_9ACTN|nr:hypothetical protein [Planosporangium mesophilum]NJC84755.1 hypothetical protein [Planosporangium mesophilum]GII24227.1 hypothetical protein Pme01_38240 [Planosporangium mesophilum]